MDNRMPKREWRAPALEQISMVDTSTKIFARIIERENAGPSGTPAAS